MLCVRSMGVVGLLITFCSMPASGDEIIGFDGKDYEYGQPSHPRHYVNHRHHLHHGHHVAAPWSERRTANAARVRELSDGVNTAQADHHSTSDMVHLRAEKSGEVRHAELCAKRASEGNKDDTCVRFMRVFCAPGSAGNQWPSQAYCSQFLAETTDVSSPAATPMSPFPAPAPAASPAGAPCGRALESNPLPDQGFHGTLVEHNNMKTSTSDWRSEYGPRTPTFKEICAKYPKSVWCKAHGYHSKPVPLRAASQTWALPIATMLAVAAIHALSA